MASSGSADMSHPHLHAVGGGAAVGDCARRRREFLTRLPSRRRASDYWSRVHRRAMACRFEITLASHDAAWMPLACAALNEIDRLEDQLSVFRPESAISDINRYAASQPVQIDDDLFALLEQSADLYRATSGAFDITSTPLSRCWGFLQRQGCLPPADAIEAARALVGFDQVSLDRQARTVRLRQPGVELNLGAIGKGHALDRVAEGMRGARVTNALLSAGRSSLVAVGGRNGGWQVEVVSPRQGTGERSLALIAMRDAALG